MEPKNYDATHMYIHLYLCQVLITVDTIGEIFMLIVVAGFDATKNCFISSYARKNYLKMRRDKHSYIMNTINLAWDGGKASTPEAPSCALRRYVKSLYRHFFLEDIAKHARVTKKMAPSKWHVL